MRGRDNGVSARTPSRPRVACGHLQEANSTQKSRAQCRDKVFQGWAIAANISILCAIPARSTPRLDANGYARLKPGQRHHLN